MSHMTRTWWNKLTATHSFWLLTLQRVRRESPGKLGASWQGQRQPKSQTLLRDKVAKDNAEVGRIFDLLERKFWLPEKHPV